MSIAAPGRAGGSPERLRALQARLQALARPYAAQLPSVLARIEACWADIEAADGGGEVGPFHEAIHQLAGTAGAYGFPEVSRHSATIDMLIGRGRREARPLTTEDMVVIRRTLEHLANVIAGIAADQSPAS